MRAHKKLRLTAIILTGFLILFGCSAAKNKTETAASIPEEATQQGDRAKAAIPETKGVAPETAYVRDITFDTVKGKERVAILLSELSPFTITRDSETVLLVKLDRMFVPEDLRTRQGEGLLDNVTSVFPFQKTEEEEQRAYIKVAVKQMVPYRVKKEPPGMITIDFDVSSLPSAQAAVAKATPSEDMDIPEEYKAIIEEEMADIESGDIKEYTGELMSLDLQDASIKSAFRLISEVSGLNIVASPEAQGKTVTMRMKKIPWDQALATILEINGLGKKQSGSVITVLPLEQLKAANEEQLKQDVSQGKLRQISIEAKIAEVSTSFAQNLGVLWGAGYQGSWGSRDYGIMMGSSSSGTVTNLPSGIGLTSSNVGVNFPSAAAVTSPAIGMVLGSSSMILNAQLSALESSGDGKIISSPKVTTLDNVQATIEQGEEIPYRSVDADGNVSTEFKKATLKLEVTPNITPDGKISMKVKANNDYADWAYKAVGTVTDNPPINTSSVDSTIVVSDGDTIVVGGVYKTTESETQTGVPYLSKIPVLGWLFKYKTVNKTKKELLIFVTPRIIEGESEVTHEG